jgi:hypothetical protein
MTHDPEAGHRRQLPAELVERLSVASEQGVEELSPARVAECLEDPRHLVHAGHNM